MDSQSNNIYSRALAEAKNELTSIRFEIESLTKRQAQLEAVIANLTPLLPQAALTLNFPKVDVPVVSSTLPPQPIWKSILLSINGKASAFTVKDALMGLERIGRPVESPNKFQIVRAVLTKKTMNFEQTGPGVFRVKSSEEDKAETEEATEVAS